MTQPISGSFSINVPIAPTPSPPIYSPAVPVNCFLCVRKGTFITAVTVYNGTYLCMNCAKGLPNAFLVNEFPPTL